MNFSDNLRNVRKQRNMTQSELGDRIGVKKSTVSGWESGARSPDIEFIERLCEALDISASDLLGFTYSNASALDDPPTYDEDKFLIKYRRITARDRNLVDSLVDSMIENAEKKKIPMAGNVRSFGDDVKIGVKSAKKERVPYGGSTAAGMPIDWLTDMYGSDGVWLPEGTGADFALKVSGDSMEPDIPDGSTIAVKSQTELHDGDYGIFSGEGEVTCKIYTVNEDGSVSLCSLNPKYPPLRIPSAAEVNIRGKVLRIGEKWYLDE